MLQRIATTLILGKPLILYLGLLTLAVWVGAISLVMIGRRTRHRVVWHGRIIGIALLLALFHMALGLSLYF